MWRALSLYLARSFSHTHTETDRLCVKQIWHHDTKSHWFYVMRKSQLTTQMGNRNAKDYDIGEEKYPPMEGIT